MLIVGLSIIVAIALFLLNVLVYIPMHFIENIHLPGVMGWLLAIALITWLMGDRSTAGDR
jgi:hypothetical protein